MKTSTDMWFGLLLLLISLIFFLFLFSTGCVRVVRLPDSGSPDLSGDLSDGGADDAAVSFSPGGNLPVGYYERQCQWDACGGPLPDKPNMSGDPLRPEGN